MHKFLSLLYRKHVSHRLHNFRQLWKINSKHSNDQERPTKLKKFSQTCSLDKAIPLLVKDLERLPDLILNFWVLEFPREGIRSGPLFLSYLVISQTNSLKLMSPSPSWSMTETISWIVLRNSAYICNLCIIYPKYLSQLNKIPHEPWAPPLLDPIQMSS